MNRTRYIVHVDMDAFFAAIEQRDEPRYRRKPVIVGSDPKGGKGRGVVSTCSYEARAFGIHSAMPISLAFRNCPHAIFLPVNMEKYEHASGEVYEILSSFTPDVEPVGIDEAFLDITGSFHLFGTALATCKEIKSAIREKTGLTASVGLAPTKTAAKIASDLNKPDGLVVVPARELLDFLWPLDIRKLWGLGPKSETAMHRMGIRTIGDLARLDADKIVRLFGKHGRSLWELANGIDARPVERQPEARSISNEITFEHDTDKSSTIESAMMALCEKVSARLRAGGLKARTITLKIRLEGFLTFTRSITISDPTNFVDTLYKEAKALYNNFDRKRKKVRLLGIKVSGFNGARLSGDLFPAAADKRQEDVHAALDRIKEKFGESSIYRASGTLRP